MEEATTQGWRGVVRRRQVAYWLGNAIWLTFSQLSAQTLPFSTISGDTTLLSIVQAVCFSLAFFATGAADWCRGPFGRRTLLHVTGAAGLVSIVLGVAGVWAAPVLLWPSAAALAVAQACGFCAWLRLLQGFGPNGAKWLLVMGSAAHIALLFAVDMWLSGVAQAAFVLGVCGPVGFAALAWNVRAGAPDGLVDTRYPAARPTRGLGQAMALPVLCAVALTLITPIATSLFGAGGNPVWGRVVKPVSHAVCLVILAAVWFGARRDLSLPRFYSVSLPLFASIILLAVAVGGPASWLVLIVGNGCYFFVSLLMVTTCLELSARFGARVVSLYGVFAGCMYLSDVAQLAVNYLMSAGVLVGAEAYVTGALLLYVVMIPVFFMVTRRKASPAVAAENGVPDENGVPAEKPADDGLPAQERPARASVEEACAQIAREVGLTPRQVEVMAGLVAGRDVVHIAESLGLAQNTVRSYRKALYAALNVHGRQELLDLVDAAREG